MGRLQLRPWLSPCIVVAQQDCSSAWMAVRESCYTSHKLRVLLAKVTHEQCGIRLQELHRTFVALVPVAVHVTDNQHAHPPCER